MDGAGVKGFLVDFSFLNLETKSIISTVYMGYVYTYTVIYVKNANLESCCFLVSCYRCETMLPLTLLVCSVVVALGIGFVRLNMKLNCVINNEQVKLNRYQHCD